MNHKIILYLSIFSCFLVICFLYSEYLKLSRSFHKKIYKIDSLKKNVKTINKILEYKKNLKHERSYYYSESNDNDGVLSVRYDNIKTSDANKVIEKLKNEKKINATKSLSHTDKNRNLDQKTAELYYKMKEGTLFNEKNKVKHGEVSDFDSTSKKNGYEINLNYKDIIGKNKDTFDYKTGFSDVKILD